MKFLVIATFIATLCCFVNAGKTKRLLAAMNAGLLGGVNGGILPGMNGGMLGGLNGGVVPGMNGGMLGGLNGGVVPGMNGGMLGGLNGVNPGLLAGGLNPPIVAGGGAGFIGQPQFVQFVPRVPALAVPAPIPNMYPAPGVNTLPFMGNPQMPPMNPAQQPQMGMVGGAAQQQLPVQADPLRRFRRQTMTPDNTIRSTMDTQIPAPTKATESVPCDKHQEDN